MALVTGSVGKRDLHRVCSLSRALACACAATGQSKDPRKGCAVERKAKGLFCHVALYVLSGWLWLSEFDLLQS